MKKVKISKEKYDNYFELIHSLKQIGLKDGFNLKLMRLILENQDLIKSVVGKATKVHTINNGMAISFEGKNYIVKETYLSHDLDENLSISQITTNCGLEIKDRSLEKVKVLK